MRKQSLVVAASALAMIALAGNAVSAAEENPRFGKWKIKSDAPAPASNIMTYEPFGKHGMKVTIDAVNKDGKKSGWWYTTNFDGKDMPVTGTPATDECSVKTISPLVNEIVNKKDGKVTQILTNVLSPDHQKIGVIYMRQDGEGHTTGITFATYEKLP
jgi:hypothetical protein